MPSKKTWMLDITFLASRWRTYSKIIPIMMLMSMAVMTSIFIDATAILLKVRIRAIGMIGKSA